jgi:CBS domain containing-hemolysin-like protein
MNNELLLTLLVIVAVLLSGLYSGAETGMYQLSRLRLRLGIERRRLGHILLGRCMKDQTSMLLSMLVANNITHYIVTSVVTALILREVASERTAELLTTAVTAPVLFVFAELIPKNLFYYRTDYLMYHLSPIIYLSNRLLVYCGAVPVLRQIALLFVRLTDSPVPSQTAFVAAQRHHVKTIFHETHEEGVFSPVQTDIVNRLVGIPNISLTNVMVPLFRTHMVEVNTDRRRLLDLLRSSDFTRLPVYENNPSNITGYINVYEALSSGEEFSDLRRFIRPIRRINGRTSVGHAINVMQNEGNKILLITRQTTRGKSRPIGIATMKDLVEELLGELSEW